MRWLTVILLFGACNIGWAQFQNAHSLSLPANARAAALGGTVVSMADGDIAQFFQNPAVLDSVKVSDVSLTYMPLFAGIYGFSGAAGFQLPRVGVLAAGVAYIDYGDFQRTDDNGDPLGDFQARDLVVTVGKSHQIAGFSLGANLKYVNVGVDTYQRHMVLMDFGGVYRSPGNVLMAGVLFKNFGWVLSDFANASNSVPFDVQVGATIKPEHMPFRFTLTAFGLTQRDTYFQSEQSVSQSKAVERADRLLRKINIGMELVIHPRIQAIVSYNHLRRQELTLSERAYGAGISLGFRLGVGKFDISYAHTTYHAAGGSDFITIQTNLKSFKKLF
ncbi:type IX secretion system protein PorQ [Marinoscillum furvescens]|uniref:Type IX secretion system PorP/SprF family membrane protein n=1 Tax=Marinoscillum furvescens DSM 4134 TaxID=1122208 RepID=A0A3D9KXU3_MARFU|nr:type IX secretion system protein PorQ [Marinoscillum furvescens]RED91591.1 hypothetical protein C7460_13911 [Marinoscillum furvescens DSM 4134]